MTVSVVVEPENDEQETVALRDVEFCVVDLETTGGSNEYN